MRTYNLLVVKVKKDKFLSYSVSRLYQYYEDDFRFPSSCLTAWININIVKRSCHLNSFSSITCKLVILQNLVNNQKHKYKSRLHCIDIAGSVLQNYFWTSPPSLINFVHLRLG